MVVVKIMGGLGNQMFQFAFALNYILNGKEVKFDTSFYQKKKVHNGFELDKVFNIRLPSAETRDIFYFAEKIINKEALSGFKLKQGRNIIQENKEMEFFYFKELAIMDDVYFSGYWQNENYFRNYCIELKTCFKFPEICKQESENYLLKKKILSSDSVSIHVRRGDYLYSSFHITLSISYYNLAINMIKKELNVEPFFFIFSDDIEWAQENIKEKNALFVNSNVARNSFRDMQLMRMCKHNIIANSTFSWWGAWLNQNNSKMVIMPKRWFTADININGLLLKDWIKI